MSPKGRLECSKLQSPFFGTSAHSNGNVEYAKDFYVYYKAAKIRYVFQLSKLFREKVRGHKSVDNGLQRQLSGSALIFSVNHLVVPILHRTFAAKKRL